MIPVQKPTFLQMIFFTIYLNYPLVNNLNKFYSTVHKYLPIVYYILQYLQQQDHKPISSYVYKSICTCVDMGLYVHTHMFICSYTVKYLYVYKHKRIGT